MKLTIEFDMDNAAFADDPQREPARILNQLAYVIEAGHMDMIPDAYMILRDINGNKVGEARVKP